MSSTRPTPRIRDGLRVAVNEYNSGLLDEDWDNPHAYQRRRAWHIA